MGALTLKSLAFYLRDWDTEKFESIDPTDGFGSNTKVYISNNTIIQIEPEYNIFSFNTWITDKGRQFFDGVFRDWSKDSVNNSQFFNNDWVQITKSILKVVYLYDHCNQQKTDKHFFTIVFENISLEVLSLLVIIAQNYPFIKVKRAENLNVNNDLEADFQTNLTANSKIKLTNSSMCILLSTNLRYEGYFLNLSLRQRFFKGNFKCFNIGSLLDLTFPIVFLGSNLNILKSIAEGRNLICQDLKLSKNPIVIYNNDLLKRYDKNSIIKILKIVNYANIFNQTWNSASFFSSTLSETGTQSISKFSPVTKNDLQNFSSLYFLNVNTDNVSNLKQIVNYKLLQLQNKLLKIKPLIINQSTQSSDKLKCFDDSTFSHYQVPSSVFYENEETYINTEGLIKRTTKIIYRKKTKNYWQMLRKIFKKIKTNITFVNDKSNKFLFFNLKNKSQFKNFIYFHYQATQSLVNLNFYLSTKTNPFTILNPKFKINKQKVINSKFKYWLDDFYSGGTDGYSQNSLIMTNASKILRSQSTNFF